MIHDNLDAALAELEAALDPDALARDVLTTTGQDLVVYDEERGPWTDRTGELRDSFRFEIDVEGGDRARSFVLTELNEADHAVFVEALQGFSVLTAFADGSAETILRDAFRQHERSKTI